MAVRTWLAVERPAAEKTNADAPHTQRFLAACSICVPSLAAMFQEITSPVFCALADSVVLTTENGIVPTTKQVATAANPREDNQLKVSKHLLLRSRGT